ncbi:MAG: secondary thiamine-phosphate synthase [Flavobacteriales bacterium]|nr:secondary thiamine-phosphate synthase [Flavobacteriales bacterium]|tara:strand:+ start:98973 stop:99377 length:405 start_codon:yes stop_codon:yes gene_type:complete
MQQYEITLPPFKRGFHIITEKILNHIPKLPKTGIAHVFIKHTSAGITINEAADPTVLQDFDVSFDKLIPENQPHYIHTLEGSDDMPAHIKSSLVGSSLSIPITNHKLNLGTWQGIYLCEFRNSGGFRDIVVTIY